MDNLKNFRKVLNYLPERIASVLKKISSVTAKDINEIRLRLKRPISVSMNGKNYFITEHGGITSNSIFGIICEKKDIDESFRAVCDYSVHSYEKNISDGFITIEGGNRVGICGTAVNNNGNTETVKYISGLNFRISGQAEGCSNEICRKLFCNDLTSVLIAGVPLSGKTTIIKDMCRILGEKYRISIIDERSEIGAVYHGEPQNQIGTFSDVFDGYGKKKGIETAVRVMSPQIVVCDEIGGKADCEAILDSVNSGVKFLASVHGKNFNEIMTRNHMKKLFDYGIFDYGVLLASCETPGKIVEIKKLRGAVI